MNPGPTRDLRTMNLYVVRAMITLLLAWGNGGGVHAYCSVRRVDAAACVMDAVCYGKVVAPPVPTLPCTTGERLPRMRLVLRGAYAPSAAACNSFLERVLWLRAAGTRWGALPTDLFNCMPHLQFLHLPANNFMKLPSDALNNLTALRLIDLSGNSIEEVPVDALINNEKLERVFLSRNNITKIHGGTFASQKFLEYLDLSYNYIMKLHADSFKGLERIKALKLNDNKLFMLNGSLKRLVSLRHLYLRHNRLHHVDVSEIPNFLRLQTLDMADNTLSSIQPEVFSRHWTPVEKESAQFQVSSVRNGKTTANIFLSKNKIIILKNATASFSGIKSRATRDNEVEVLDSKIPETILPTVIDLSSNLIETIEFNAFTGIAMITTLDLSSNKLKFFTVNTTSLQYLEQLILKNNQISSFDAKTFRNLGKLTKFDASGNTIASLSNNSYWAPGDLNSLELSGNSLQRLDSAALGPLDALVVVMASNNQLAAVRLDGRDVPGLRRLSLRTNHLTDLRAVQLYRLLQLATLDLAHNRLTTLPATAFAHLSALRHLDLGSNNISILDAGAFTSLNRLTKLDLSDNELSSVNFGSFAGVERLEQLDLSGNRLTLLDSRVLFDMQALWRLNLEDNQLVELDTSAWKGRNASVRVDVAGNRMPCAAVERALVDERLGYSGARLAGREGSRGEAPSVGDVPCVAPPPPSDSVPTPASSTTAPDDRLLYTNRNILNAILTQTAELKKAMKKLSYWKLAPKDTQN